MNKLIPVVLAWAINCQSLGAIVCSPGRSSAGRTGRASRTIRSRPCEFGPDKNVKWKVAGPERAVVADRRRRQARHHRVRRRQALHHRLQPRRRQGSVAGGGPGEEDRAVPQDRGQPGRVHARDRRRADRLVLRLVRAVLLRPGRQGTLEVRDADGGDRGGLRHAASRRSSPTASSSSSATRRRTRRSSPLDAATGSLKWEKKRQSPSRTARPVVWDTPAGKQVVAAGHGRMIGYDLKTGDEKWSVAGMPSGVLLVAGRRRTARCSSPAGRPAARTTRSSRCRRSTPCSRTGTRTRTALVSKEEAEKTF